MELYGQVRYAVQIEGISRREAARRLGIDPRTVAKMLSFSVPPGTGGAGRRRARSWTRSPESSTRSWHWMRDGRRSSGTRRSVSSNGCATSTPTLAGSSFKDYMPVHRLQHHEVFVPLRHDPGHAQVDFGEALAEIAGVERKIHFLRWTCRTAIPVLCGPIRRKSPKRSATGITPRILHRFSTDNASAQTRPDASAALSSTSRPCGGLAT